MPDPLNERHLVPNVEQILHQQEQEPNATQTSSNTQEKYRHPTLEELTPTLKLHAQPTASKRTATNLHETVHREVNVPALET